MEACVLPGVEAGLPPRALRTSSPLAGCANDPRGRLQRRSANSSSRHVAEFAGDEMATRRRCSAEALGRWACPPLSPPPSPALKRGSSNHWRGASRTLEGDVSTRARRGCAAESHDEERFPAKTNHHYPPRHHHDGDRDSASVAGSNGAATAAGSRVAGPSPPQIARRVLLIATVSSGACWLLAQLSSPAAESAAAADVATTVIDLSKEPTASMFDPDADRRLREAVDIFRQAMSAPTVKEEERLWTMIINRYGELNADWAPDILSRAWGNRGNARSRQGKLEEALEDYTAAIQLAPYAIDPVLNRGVALESLGRYKEAARDYQAVLDADPRDPAAWNNLGNVMGALGEWDEAAADYNRAWQLAPEFSFAAGNYGLALYEVGEKDAAIRQFRTLLRRYPEFPDMRAALAVSLYADGMTAEAETNWGRLEDPRYRDRNWVRNTRRWPPKLVKALVAFLDVKPV